MILELVIAGCVLSGASVFAGIRQRRRQHAEAKREHVKPREATRGDGLAVSDVVLYLDHEFWLSGCVALSEEGEQVARLFRTPAAEPIIWLGELGRAKEIVLFEQAEDVPAGRIGDELPMGERNLRLTRRGHATMEAQGEQLPSVSPDCAFTLLSDGSGRRLLILDESNGRRWTLLGESVGRELLDVLPGSQSAP